jgi:TldD protein
MRDFAIRIRKRLPPSVDYSDARVVETEYEHILVRNGNVESCTRSSEIGFGVRTLLNGAWGFYSSNVIENAEIDRVIDKSLQIAKASGVAKGKPVLLSHLNVQKGRYETKMEKNPFDVSMEDKIGLLLSLDGILSKYKNVKVRTAMMTLIREKKVFVSTDGSVIEQDIVHTGAVMTALAVREREVQKRSYGDFGQAGYEFIEGLRLLEEAPRIGEEAEKLLEAKPCPSSRKDIVISDDQMVLQVHESVGHPTELDRVFGTEASYAGTSFVTPEKLGSFKYGSKSVNITADATIKNGLGGFGWDDEGVPSQRIYLIKEGIFNDYLSSRDTAPLIGKVSTGTMRASSWSRIPIIRMTNINLEPGDATLEELIDGVNDGLYLLTNKSWSIDDKRINFQFGVELAYEIKNGKLGEIIKDATYTGITPEFWGSCDGIANKNYWKMHGVMNCGKGEPGQSMRVGHGTAPARFRNVQVGVFRK